MAEFLLAASASVLAMTALGLARVLRGPGDADRMMAAQLLGTGGVGALLLFGVATGASAAVDVALTLALLAAFASIGFVKASAALQHDDTRNHGPPMTLVLDFFTISSVAAGAFFPGRYGRASALSRRADAPARAHQGGQHRPGPGGAWIVADGRRRSGRDQACPRLAARLAVQCDDLATDRARRATRGQRP